MELLFTMAHWHGLAKLRMHNDRTLSVMDALTVSLGDKFRAFVTKTCPTFETRELSREVDARVRRQNANSAPKRCRTNGTSSNNPQTEANAQTINQISSNSLAATQQSTSGSSTKLKRRRKTFNINTYKFHSFGDYVETIRQIGTMDSFSTEPVRSMKFQTLKALIS